MIAPPSLWFVVQVLLAVLLAATEHWFLFGGMLLWLGGNIWVVIATQVNRAVLRRLIRRQR